MNLKPSRITVGFTLLGLVVALGFFGLGLIPADSPADQRSVESLAETYLYICPGGIATVAIGEHTPTLDLVEIIGFVVLSNMLIYFIIGLCVSFVARKVKRWMDPTTILQS